MEDAILDTDSLHHASASFSFLIKPLCVDLFKEISQQTKCQQKIIIRIYRKIYYETNLNLKMTLCIFLTEYAYHE